ncbi:hypothetical protein DFH06DRAFT_1344853 [Mycena polygramma]|nr:hypothetical protein DFH06DRAFT_1344853 [Mycena polygramma]
MGASASHAVSATWSLRGHIKPGLGFRRDLIPKTAQLWPNSMLTTLAPVFLFVSFVAAQAVTLPQCAQGCANEAATKGQCSLSDTACLCKTSFASSVLQCAGIGSCSPADDAELSTILEGLSSTSVPVSASVSSGSSSASASVSPPSTSIPSSSLTKTTITSTVTTVSPPHTTTFISSVPVSNTVVPPPISISSLSPSSSIASNLTPTIPASSSSSVAPSSPSTGAAQSRKACYSRVVGGLIGIAVLLL